MFSDGYETPLYETKPSENNKYPVSVIKVKKLDKKGKKIKGIR